MKIFSHRWALAVLTATVLFSATISSAQAQQDEKMPAFDAHPELSHVAQDLAVWWAAQPQLFAQLQAVRQWVRRWDAQGAQRGINPARSLTAMGPEALLPILWALVADDPFTQPMGLQGWMTWRVGLIEAAGRLRDSRSLPVFMALIEGPDPLDQIHRVATSALGRTGDVEAIDDVIELAREDETKRPAIVAGLGAARRATALDYLLEVAQSTDDAELRRLAIRALGDWGNRWAWETETLAQRQEEGAKGRQEIIDRLVGWYGEADESVGDEIVKSLHLAGTATARQAAQDRAAQAQDEPTRRAYEQLQRRLARSPLD